MVPNYSHSLGLTGGIACGKSTAGAWLENYGWVRFDADAVAREVVEPGTEGLAEVVSRFGPEVLGEDGRLDRTRLGRLVFFDRAARRDLEGILHPRIWERLVRARTEAERTGTDTLFEIPLLFENRREDEFTEVWAVVCSPQEQRERLLQRPGMEPSIVDGILQAQLPLEVKRRRAHLVLDSSGPLEQFRETVREAHRNWLERKGLPR